MVRRVWPISELFIVFRMNKELLLVSLFVLLAGSAFAQKYRDGGVTMYNARGKNWDASYHKLQFGVVLPGTMPGRKNVWYAKNRDKVVDGTISNIPISLRYAWSSNPNTEFIVQADYERTQYYDVAAINSITHFRDFYTLNVGMNYKWWQQRLLTVYSGLTIGGGYGKFTKKGADIQATYPDEVDQKDWAYPSAQLTAIGITWGKKVGGFAELAFGSKGVFNGGVYWKF